MNFTKIGESAFAGAVVFASAEAAGYASSGVQGLLSSFPTAFPLAVTTFGIIYKTGINQNESSVLLNDIKGIVNSVGIALGIKSQRPSSSAEAQAAGSGQASSSNAAQPQTQNNTPQANLSALPGFSLAAAKAGGFRVYVNPNYPGNIVLLNQGIWSDAYGNKITLAAGQNEPPGTDQEI